MSSKKLDGDYWRNGGPSGHPLAPSNGGGVSGKSGVVRPVPGEFPGAAPGAPAAGEREPGTRPVRKG